MGAYLDRRAIVEAIIADTAAGLVVWDRRRVLAGRGDFDIEHHAIWRGMPVTARDVHMTSGVFEYLTVNGVQVSNGGYGDDDKEGRSDDEQRLASAREAAIIAKLAEVRP